MLIPRQAFGEELVEVGQTDSGSGHRHDCKGHLAPFFVLDLGAVDVPPEMIMSFLRSTTQT